MSKTLRNKIAYWFYLIIGLLGSSKQLYGFLTDQLELTLSQGILTTLFGVFIFQPLILPKTFREVVAVLIKLKTALVSYGKKLTTKK